MIHTLLALLYYRFVFPFHCVLASNRLKQNWTTWILINYPDANLLNFFSLHTASNYYV